jgi:CheY-like chemotaxis protein
VLDIMMPGMNGFEFISRFRELPGRGRVPIVVWTMRDLTPEEQERLAESYAIFLPKGPDGTEQLLVEVARWAGHALGAREHGG